MEISDKRDAYYLGWAYGVLDRWLENTARVERELGIRVVTPTQ